MERSIKALIVDDDASSRSILQKFIEVGNKIHVVASVNNTLNATLALEKFSPDVIFLDINMPYENGIQFAQKIRQAGNDIQIVFTTAYREFAATAYDLKPLDFMVKPFDLSDVFDMLTKIQNFFDEQDFLQHEKNNSGLAKVEKIKFKTHTGYLFINPKDVLFFKVNNEVVELYLINGEKQRIIILFKTLYDQLKNYNFLKINRSVIVNLNKVEKVDKKKGICYLKGEKEEYSFVATASICKYFENINALKLG